MCEYIYRIFKNWTNEDRIINFMTGLSNIIKYVYEVES